MNNLIDAYIAWENAQGAHMRSQGTELMRVIATDLSTANGPIVDRAVLPPVIGLVATAPCPSNVTMAVALRTGHRGRSYRGRIFHIGTCETMRVGNLVAAATITDTVQRYTLLLSLGVAPIFHLGVLSRRQNKVDLDPQIWTQATSVTLDNELDSQRRRLPGHNRHG